MSTGNVEQLKSGKWRARIMVNGETYREVFGTPEEAEEFCVAVSRTTKQAEAAPVTLASWTEKWIEQRSRNKELRYPRKEHALRQSKIDTWSHAHRPIRALQRRHVAAYVESLLNRGLSRQTAKHVLRLIRTSLAAAADAGIVSENVALEVKVPTRKAAREDRAWTWLTNEEIRNVIGACEGAARIAWFTLAVYGGLRKSELIHLRWENVKFEEGVVEIRAPLKSGHALRDVPMLDVVVDALAAWKKESASTNGYVWPARSGGRHQADYDGGWADGLYKAKEGQKRFHGIRTRAAIGRRVRFHDLRHTCASHLIQGTWGQAFTLYEVRDWLGHSSITVTMRYAHLSPGGIRGKAAMLSGKQQ